VELLCWSGLYYYVVMLRWVVWLVGMGGMLSLPWIWLSNVCRRTSLCGDLRSGGLSGLVWGGPCSSWVSKLLEGGCWVSSLVFEFWGCVSECNHHLWDWGVRVCVGVPDVLCHNLGLCGFVFLWLWLLCGGRDVICYGSCLAGLVSCVRELSMWWCFLLYVMFWVGGVSVGAAGCRPAFPLWVWDAAPFPLFCPSSGFREVPWCFLLRGVPAGSGGVLVLAGFRDA
jgi:hypothetical protein